MGRSPLALAVTGADGAPLTRLRYANTPGTPAFRYHPDRIHVTATLGDVLATEDAGSQRGVQVRLTVPRGWLTLPGTTRFLPAGESSVSWTVYPRGLPGDYTVSLRVEVLRDGRVAASAETSVAVTVEAYSQFDPARHSLPFANTVADLGVVRPDPALFARTYRLTLLPQAFFRGLYGAVVFLGGESGAPHGGLCTGMARAALEQSLDALPPGANLLNEVIILHGRQLTDRALLSSAPWFFWPGPARAFRRFRADLLSSGRSDRCWDIGVPRPWRRDIARALVGEGHTVVPYGFRQESPDRVEVLVWDPNHPTGPGAAASILTLDLHGDTYGYRHRAALGERRTTIIAVRQSAYRRGRTALLASAASLLLYPASVGLTRRRLTIGSAVLAGATGIALTAARVTRRVAA